MQIVNYEFKVLNKNWEEDDWWKNPVKVNLYITIPDCYDEVISRLLINLIAAQIVQHYSYSLKSEINVHKVEIATQRYGIWCDTDERKLLKEISDIYYQLRAKIEKYNIDKKLHDKLQVISDDIEKTTQRTIETILHFEENWSDSTAAAIESGLDTMEKIVKKTFELFGTDKLENLREISEHIDGLNKAVRELAKIMHQQPVEPVHEIMPIDDLSAIATLSMQIINKLAKPQDEESVERMRLAYLELRKWYLIKQRKQLTVIRDQLNELVDKGN